MTSATVEAESAPRQHLGGAEGPAIASVFSLVLWLSCVTIGVLGFALPYLRPQLPRAAQAVVEVLNVELTDQAAPPDVVPKTDNSSDVFSEAPAQVSIPTPVPVARPSPAIAFAVPVEGPVSIVNTRKAGYTAQAPSAAAVSAPQPLTFGHGEGRQEKPPYPLQARRTGQEGRVVIRMTVGEQGRVLAAEIVSPSPWPLLNQSALRTVRERWRFTPGKTRLYEVAILFELPKSSHAANKSKSDAGKHSL